MTVGRIWANGEDKGSGFALATPPSRTTRVVLTAKHVVGDQEPSSLQFLTQDKRRIPVEGVERDDDLDVAVLHLSEDVAEGLAVSHAVEDESWQVETQPRPNDPKLYGTIIDTHRPFVKKDGGHEIHVLQLDEKQSLGDYKGYSGSPVVLKSQTDVVIGVLIEQLRSRLSVPPGHPKPATNVLYAIPIQDVLERFDLTYKLFERRSITNLIIDSKVREPIVFLPEDLPEGYIDRPAAMDILRKALLGDQSKVVLTAAVHGMGGLGKTVLARAICNDPVIKGAFPDGILWAKVGQNPKPNEMHLRLSEIQEQWITVLGGDASAASNETLGKVELQRLLKKRAMLLVLDDVWHHSDIEYLKVAGPRCRILITTRDKTVVDTRALIELDVMSVEESRELLKTASGGKPKDDELADKITEHLGHLPLAIDIVARMLANGVKWSIIAKVLTSKFKEIKHGDKMLATIATSVSFLDSEKQQRYYELIAFPQDEKIVEGAAAKLWKHAGLDLLDASLLLAEFRQCALLQNNNTLHDILYDYLRSIVGIDEQRNLHSMLVNAYGGPGAWQAFPDDPEDDEFDEFYAWRRIGYHLSRAERLPELRELLTDGDFLKAKIKLLGVAEVLPDYTYLSKDERLQLVATALQLGARVLYRDPDQLRNQIYGRLGTMSDIHDLSGESKPFLNLDSFTLTRPNAPALSSFKGHKGSVFGCVFSPDEQQVLSASADSSLRIWNIDSGKTVRTFEGHSGAVNDCVFTHDGQMIVSASNDSTLRIWNTSSGRTMKILQGHTNSVKSCTISPNGKIILSASADKSLRLWDISDGKPMVHYDFTKPDDKLLHTEGINEGSAAEIHSTGPFSFKMSEPWGKSFQILVGHQAGVNCCAFHPNGQLIASGADDNTVRLWDLKTGQTIHTLEGHAERVLSCSFSINGNLLASSSEDKTIRIWDVNNGQIIRVLEGHTDFVHCCTFSPDGTNILSASADYTLRIWNITTGQTEQVLPGHHSWVNKCCFSQNGQRALSASYDGSLRLWNLPEGITIKVFAGDIGYLRDCTFRPDGKYALSARADGSLQLWDAYQHISLREFRGHNGYASSCAFSPNGDLIVSASSDTSLRLWDFYTSETIRILKGHKGNIYQCIFSPDGAFVLSASGDKTLRLWNVNTGDICNIFEGHEDIVRGCSFSPDGKLILSSSWDNTLRLWDTKTGQTVRLLQGHDNHVRGCTFSPDGKYVLSASYDTTLKLWNVEDGKCIHTFEGHTNWVFDCAFTPSGELFISVADDHTLKLWRVETGEEVASWVADAPLTCCDINHDGTRIICGDSFGNLHFLLLEKI